MTTPATLNAVPEDGADPSHRVPARAIPPTSMIERMTLILDAFDRTTPFLSLIALAERTSLPRSTVHRILDQMIRLRWLTHCPGGYRLGTRPLELGGLAADHNEIRDVTAPLLHELCQRTGMVGHVAVLDAREVLYLEKAGGRLAASLPTRLGGRMPAHSTALGKALLASLDADNVTAMYSAPLTSLTSRTISDLGALRRDLMRIRARRGVAMDDGESVSGISCVAAAVRGGRNAVAAMSLCGETGTMRPDRLAGIVLEATCRASRSLFPHEHVSR